MEKKLRHSTEPWDVLASGSAPWDWAAPQPADSSIAPKANRWQGWTIISPPLPAMLRWWENARAMQFGPLTPEQMMEIELLLRLDD